MTDNRLLTRLMRPFLDQKKDEGFAVPGFSPSTFFSKYAIFSMARSSLLLVTLYTC